LVGRTIGDFELLEEIGRGGMGVVFKARQKSLDRIVALKMLLDEHFLDPVQCERFQAEARVVAGIGHPNIVNVFQVGECEYGRFFAMEYIDGQTLRDVLLEKKQTPIPWAVNLLIVVGEAVHHAHGKGVVHRDLNPANIMIDRFRRPIVMDFGIARCPSKSAALTPRGAIVGTPAYMAPEQAGDDMSKVGPASDVYSLGAIFYTLLTGKLPYEAATPLLTVLKVIDEEMPAPVRSLRPDVPAELEQVCMKCLSKKPSDRFATAQALVEALRRFRAAPPRKKAAAVSRRLVVTAGPDEGLVFTLPESDTLLIGRSRAAEGRLIDPHVSRVHCQIQVDGDLVQITDFDSAGGTLVNGQLISQQQLKPGDVIQVGITHLRFVTSDPVKSPTVVPAAAAPVSTAWLGQLIGKRFSRYEIGPVLAKGQSGAVFHARDTREDQPVAFKVLGPEFAKNEESMQRFVRAMKTMLPVRHPNIITIYNAGKTGPHCWIAMEYVEGENLTQMIQRIGTAGMLDWRAALRVALHIGRALDHAHGLRIVHRHFTPMNILVRAHDKVAKLGDLMLAKALEGAEAEQITTPGQLLGEVGYLPPERTQGSGTSDCRSDIYGLGATVYALLTGRPPHEDASLAETLAKIRKAEPVRPKKFQLAIPDLFEDAVLKMLAKRTEDRYQTAAALLADLERIAKYQGVTA
jgi:serine/threonine protein kinase